MSTAHEPCITTSLEALIGGVAPSASVRWASGTTPAIGRDGERPASVSRGGSCVDDKPACSLCLHRCDERWVGDGKRAFCTRCLVAIGGFVLRGTGRARFWPAIERAPLPVAPISEAERERRYAEYTVEEVFAEFAAGMSMTPDAETHLDLAIAYREMGLESDALAEAALALQQEVKLSRPRALEALSFVVDRPHGVDEWLMVLREALFTN